MTAVIRNAVVFGILWTSLNPLLAAPAANEEACVSEYERKGGALVQVDPGSFNKGIPYEFDSCGRIGCGGTLDLKGIVQKDGRVRDVVITSNAYGSGGRPDAARAEIFRKWFTGAMRYQPPKLNGKPVCIIRGWRYVFE